MWSVSSSMRNLLSLSVSLFEFESTRFFRQTKLPYWARNMGSVICKNIPPTETKTEKCPNMEEQEFVEEIVCKDSDILENELKTVDIQDIGKVLLIRHKGKLNALGTKCTHYGAPLVSSALGDGRIRCQWHGACFNVETGDIEDFPGLDSLPCYRVTIEDEMVKVRARKTDLQTNKRMKSMVKRDEREGTTMVIIGGGPSGAVCAETLRQEGFNGRIVIINKENCLPYDRIKLSKAFDIGIEKLQLRTDAFYSEYGIEVKKATEAVSVDSNAKTVLLSTGEKINFDCLYIATGSKPRRLEVQDSNLPEVRTLRGFEDSQELFERLNPEKYVVCLGVSFIGMEAAAYCTGKAKSVTVIGRGGTPFEPVFGPEIGARVMRLFEEKGVKFIMNSGIEKCIKNGGILTNLQLTGGETIPADLCIVGIGSTFYTDFLKKSDIELTRSGAVIVNQYLETNIKSIFAGGDIANAPVNNPEEKTNIGHYSLAHYHGKIAALNMLGKQKPIKAVPYFWTVLFGKSFRYAGHGQHAQIKIVGDLEELKYVAFHINKEEKVVAMSSCQHDPIVSQFANLLYEGKQLTLAQITKDPFAWTKNQ